MAGLEIFKNWRFDPFTDTYFPVLITDEIHVVEFHAEWNNYGIELNEAPLLEAPSTVDIREDDSAEAQFIEVPRSTPPSAGEYRVDYEANTFWGTGRIEFNGADDTKDVKVTYFGLGTVVKNKYQILQVSFISTSLHIAGQLQLDEDPTAGSVGTLEVGNRNFNDERYVQMIQNGLIIDPMVLNQNNFDLTLGANDAAFDNVGEDLKQAIVFSLTDSLAVYKPYFSSNNVYIQADYFDTYFCIFRINTVSSFDGDFFIQTDWYDKDKVLLGTKKITLNQIYDLSGGLPPSSFTHFLSVLPLGSDLTNAKNAVYFRLSCGVENRTTGTLYLDYWQVQKSGALPPAIIEETLSYYHGTMIPFQPADPDGVFQGLTSEVFILAAAQQQIDVDIVAAQNEVINASEVFPFMIKAVNINPTGVSSKFSLYKGDSGSTKIVNFKAAVFGLGIWLPVSYYDVDGKAYLRLFSDDNGSNLIVIQGFKFI